MYDARVKRALDAIERLIDQKIDMHRCPAVAYQFHPDETKAAVRKLEELRRDVIDELSNLL